MSKNIIVQKNGVAQNLTVDTLRLKKQDGGTEDWLPADGKNLVELQIGGSGTYKASDYNAYGIAVARVTPKYGGGATSKAAEHDFTEKHTPAIKEGGKSRNFSAAMLKANLQGGGTCLWIPRMDVELKNKYISKSGTYTAKADDCYGFDQITVSGVDVEITQDEDGDDVERTTDGGEVTETKLPSYIRVTVMPSKLDYTVGETIDYTGLVVHAYTKSGIDMGVVPFNELILPAEKAGEGWAEEWTDGHGLNAMQIAYTPHWNREEWVQIYPGRIDEEQVFVCGSALGTINGKPASYGDYSKNPTPGTLFVTRYQDTNYMASVAGSRRMDVFAYWSGELLADQVKRTGWFYASGSSGEAGINKFVSATGGEWITNIPVSTVDPTTVDPSTLYSIGEAIPVQWHRSGDGELLETSFNIYTHSA